MTFGYENAIDEKAQVYYSYGGPDATPVHLLHLAQDLVVAHSARKLLARGLYADAAADVRPPAFPQGASRRFGLRVLKHGLVVKLYERRCNERGAEVARELDALEGVVRRHFADVRGVGARVRRGGCVRPSCSARLASRRSVGRALRV
jgi:hypothetical protein